MSRDFGLEELKGEPSPDPVFQPLDGHKILRTLAAVVAAAALVFIGIQEKRQADELKIQTWEERGQTYYACTAQRSLDFCRP